MVGRRRRFALSDTVQQIVGGFLLAGPFVVTEEVWVLAQSMSPVQALFTVIIVLAIGYGALYKADDRNPERESEVGGIPLRFISLVSVSYLSVFILAVAFDAPGTFLDATATGTDVLGVTLDWAVIGSTLKAISIGAVFSVIGAATADSLY
ncbi:DUF2391 family protein [Halobellus limi]|jgi:uncharacterized membrane protein|uniref:DUF2391 family protein n=1 Tax=Halobellus limi TaxID=699433 RepID=A0A1H5X4I5_9EURY|nr:DUF2391 family protein [Halobellus limi]QCC46265.1 DUF2391 family protein [Halobellus limi]SEG06335.1 Putative integral membrane protein [Halobellus limi]